MNKKVIITGSTGMVGSMLLHICLHSEKISEVVALVRKKSGIKNEKLKVVVVNDFLNYEEYVHHFKNVDIVFYCLGVYTGAVPPNKFREITVDYPLALAASIVKHSPQTSFCLLSGQGADRSEQSKIMFARDKGAAENGLAAIGFKSFYTFRPGYIYPTVSRKEPNLFYQISRIAYPLIKLLGNNLSVTSEQLAKAMFLVGVEGHSAEIIENREIRMLAK